MSDTSTPIDEQDKLIMEATDQRRWAVVGASTSPAKWGYRVYDALRRSGYDVYPVNPRAPEIDGRECFGQLAALPEVPAVVCVVLPPKLGFHVAEEAAELGIPYIWFQPGAESPENVSRARHLGLKVITGACAIVARKAQWQAGTG